ncbi:Gldg family protein [Gemmata sp. G18]|uniref:Gldg family protein n=1 Tax=Gemmata palustris TaxID=2822762 RepID=A0ABS5BV26_9BACT|nr:Gldg family protein [Gemmata palustris]MBP3957282.1 Gldg family protein [Gemmata palustris]
MQPTPPVPVPNAPAPNSGNPVVEFVRTQRQNAGSVLAGLAVVLLALAGYMAVKGFRDAPAPAPDKPQVENPLDPERPESAKPVAGTKEGDFRWGAIAALSAFLVAIGGAARLLVSLPRTTESQQRAEARAVILAVGGALAWELIATGGVFFYRWSESIVNWLEKGQEEEARYVLIPVLMIAFGAALGLAAITPARAEERNNPSIRKLVYGTNLGLTALVLFVVLVIANVVFAYRVSNKIDMTGSGFYSMSPRTEEFLRGLDQPIEAYAILPGQGSRVESDLRDVLTRFQETSRDKFRVRFLSPVSSTADLAELKANYPPVQDGELGVLLTFPGDKKRFSFIPVEEFFTTEPGPRGETPKTVFTGEGRLVKELLFLADNKQKPKVYFTQSSDELELAGRTDPERAATRLRTFLEKNYLDVQPLTFEGESPKVPDDCAVLVVADPQKPLDPKYVDAVRKYMTERKGRLVVLSGATLPGPNLRKVTPTGLEPVLAQFNVGLSDKYLFALSADRRIPVTSPPVEFTQAAADAKNPIVRLFRRISIQMPLPREVNALNTTPGMTATPLLTTDTEGGAWLADEFPANPNVRPANAVAVRRRTVGVVVAEGGNGRVAVYGNGLMVCDALAGQFGAESPPAFDLLGATIDWLRDRPPVPQGVESKAYAVYALPGAKTIDGTRLKYMPVIFGLIVVVSLGLGTWVIRRQQA